MLWASVMGFVYVVIGFVVAGITASNEAMALSYIWNSSHAPEMRTSSASAIDATCAAYEAKADESKNGACPLTINSCAPTGSRPSYGNFIIIDLSIKFSNCNTDSGEWLSNVNGRDLPPRENDDAGAGAPHTCNPVNIMTGNKFYQALDYAGTGSFPLSFTRTYNSRRALRTTGAPFAQWTLSYTQNLRRQYSDRVSLYRDDGQVIVFKKDTEGGWQPSLATRAMSLVEEEDNGQTSAWVL